ncbi:MAG: XRE family transcriptional regulator [Gemmatimonadales bacterium]
MGEEVKENAPLELERLIAAVRDFTPERLTLAREMAGLDIKDVAERIQATPSAVSQLESGRTRPKAETLIRLALALGVRPQFLGAPALPQIAPESCFFRSRKSTTMRERRRVLAHGTILKQLADYLGEFVVFPEEQLTPLRRQLSDRSQIEEFSITVRDAWHLGQGPISDMIGLLEDRGVLPVEVPGHSERLDAFSAWIGGKPLVFLTVDKGSSSRRRFDAAHELAHLLLHDASCETQAAEIEREADAFASAFLLPAVPFLAECPRRLDWNRLRALKRRWGVSLAAIVRRAFDLRIFGEATYRRAYSVLNQVGWRTNEPDEPSMERPALLQRALRLLQQAGHSPGRVAADLRIREGALVDLVLPARHEQIALVQSP